MAQLSTGQIESDKKVTNPNKDVQDETNFSLTALITFIMLYKCLDVFPLNVTIKNVGME